MNFLAEHNLLDYAELEGKAADATARHNELSEEIKAAKKAFDELAVEKLPTVKKLQTEYAQLLEKKKEAYRQYRGVREEMRQLLTAKANVDRILGDDYCGKKERNNVQR